MKTILYLIPFILIGSAFQSPDHFTLQGKIGQLNAPAKLYFSYTSGQQNHSDSAVLVNGVFKFEGHIDCPTTSRLILDYDGKGMESAARQGHTYLLYIGKGKNVVSSVDSLHRLQTDDSPINEKYNIYNDYIGGSMQELSARMGEKFTQAGPDMQKDKNFMKKMNDEFHQLIVERWQKQIQYIRQYPESFFSLAALSENQISEKELPLLDSLFRSLTPEWQNCSAGKSYEARLTAMRNTAIGNIAPDFTQNDTSNRTIKLSDFRGKYLLLDFWASWCGPCRAENPYMTRAYDAYKNKNFEILGVSLDGKNTHKAWIEAIRKDGVTWPQVSDLNSWDNQAALLYGIRAIPQNYLLDPQGKIIAKNLRGEELLIKLKEILNK